MTDPQKAEMVLTHVRKRVASEQRSLEPLGIRIELLEPSASMSGGEADEPEVVVNFWREKRLLDVLEFSLGRNGGSEPVATDLIKWFDAAFSQVVQSLRGAAGS